MKIALIQLHVQEEQPEVNLARMAELSRNAARQGATIVLFPEVALTDYVSDVDKFAEEVPNGPASQEIWKLAAELNIYISFGLIEKEGIHRYITQVFLGPHKYVYRYRKTWLYSTTDTIKAKRRHRHEPDYFNPGNGPELFEIAGLKASCIICNDGNSKQGLTMLKKLQPEIVFFPNNREIWPATSYWSDIAQQIGAPLLITNRVGNSWGEECEGGSSFYSKEGELVAGANREGQEEILMVELDEKKGLK